MNSTKVQENPIIYPNLANLIDLKSDNVKPFLPLLEKYSFLQVYKELRHLLEMYVYFKGIKQECNFFSRVSLVIDSTLTMHALIEGWDIKAYQSLDKYFYELAHVDAGPLEFCGYLDMMLNELALSDDGSLERVVVVVIALRQAFLRTFALNNKIDLSEYLDYKLD